MTAERRTWFLKCTYGLLALIFGAITYLSILYPYRHILEMPDDCGYPYYAGKFLKQGCFENASAKHGVVLLEALCGCVSFWSSTIFFIVCGLLTIFALWVLSREFIGDSLHRLIPSALWGTSLWYAYYSKTHLMVFAVWYLLGLAGIMGGLWRDKKHYYIFGWVCLGFSALAYYVAVIYIPFIFLYAALFWFFEKRGSIRNFLLATIIPGAIPIVILDGIVVVFRLLFRIKNDPFFMTLYWQLSGVTRSLGEYDILYYPRFFASSEPLFFRVLFVLSCGVLCCLVVKKRPKAIALLCMLAPSGLLIARAWMGHLSVPRTFVGVLPIFFLVTVYSLECTISKKYLTLTAFLLAIVCCVRLFNQKAFLPTLYTGYAQVAQRPEMKDVSIVYYGRPFTWEMLLPSAKTIALNRHQNGLFALENEQVWQSICQEIVGMLQASQKVVLAISYALKTDVAYIEKRFSSQFTTQRIIHEPAPHWIHDFILEEDNYWGLGGLSLLRGRVYPWIDVYSLSLK